MRGARRSTKPGSEAPAKKALGSLFRSSGKRRQREIIDLVRESPLFDQRWYLDRYPDVLRANVDPVRHFLEAGWREGRDPGPGFSTTAYLRGNADVAQSGINPLIHYLEFGQSEGREIRSHNPNLRRLAAVKYKFAPPAPVFRGAIPTLPAAPWLQSYRLDHSDERLFTAEGWTVGYARTAAEREAAASAFSRLRAMSGFAESDILALPDAPFGKLVDAWFVNRAQLRARWDDIDFPLAVRAYQHDQFAPGGQLAMVAEHLLESPLDYVDCTLGDAFFPILFVFADPGGAIVGSTTLALPSLCRGGLHYAELIAEADALGRNPDPVAAGREHLVRLAAARLQTDRLAATVTVDLTGADGTSPMFQRGFRGWLDKMAGIKVAARGDGAAADALAKAGKLAAAGTDGGSFIIGADMIPTIGILSAVRSPSGADDSFAPLLITKPDPSQPAFLADIGRRGPEVLGATAAGEPLPWPRLQTPSADGYVPVAAAIRLGPGRTLTDAELLVPTSGPVPEPEEGEPTSITWLLAVDRWQVEDLVESARALLLQSAAATHTIAFVGTADREKTEAASKILGARIRTFDDFAAASRVTESEYIGFLGRGVILHDLRMVEHLLSALADPAVTASSCPLVAAERRGKSWHLSMVDAGSTVQQPGGEIVQLGDNALDLWKTCYPVARMPRNLWLARAQDARDWFSDDPDGGRRGGFHLCSALVTASSPAPPGDSGPAVTPPPTTGTSMRTKVVFG